MSTTSEDRDSGDKLTSPTLSMESQVEQHAQPKPPMLFVGEKDSTRLLEAYVKRSLSLNDGSHCTLRRARRTRKWVSPAEQVKRDRKHSSDISLHLKPLDSEEDLGEDEAFSEPEIDNKTQVEHERTNNKSKLLKKKSTLSRNYGSSASSLSDGKPQNWLVHFDKDKPDGKQPKIPSIHLKPTATEEDLSKDKVFLDQVTESEISDKSKQGNRGSLTRKDGSSASQSSEGKPRKWFLHFDKDKRNSRPHDPFKPELEGLKIGASTLLPQPQLDSLTEVKKTKGGKKTKKPSIWKSVLGWFSRGNTGKQDDEDEDGRSEEPLPTPETATPALSCLPISTGDGIILRHTKTTRRKRSQRRLSLKQRSGDMGLDKTSVRPFTLDISTEAHNSQVQSDEATSSYYEKMSEELNKIVYEVKNSPTDENRTLTDSIEPIDIEAVSRPQEEIIKRIIDLIKQEGDVINDKLSQNTVISSFFNTITYGSFQQLADRYVNSEVHQQKAQPTVVAPELVKFAFTLDFTARVAALSRHAPGHILGFGNQYLKERFTYMCESHPYDMDINTEKPVTVNESSNRADWTEDHAAFETDGPKHEK